MRRNIMAVASAAMLTLTLGACGSSGSAGAQSGDDGGNGGGKPYISIVSKGFQHQFWQSVKDGAENAAEEFDVEINFVGPDSESDVAQQIQMLTTELNKDPDALAFAALDSKAAEPLLQQAEDSGTPVVAFDSGVDSEIPVTTVATDNKAAAALAAEHMAELIGGEGQVAVVAHSQTALSGTQRRDGFVEWMAENAPDIEIVDVQYGGGDQLESTNVAKSMMTANPELDGIFGTNEGSAIGVVNAVNELGKKGEIVIVGFDSGKAQLQAIRSGVMAGAVTQAPVSMGYQTVESAVKAINGEELSEFIGTDFYWYDSENIDSEKIQSNVYE